MKSITRLLLATLALLSLAPLASAQVAGAPALIDYQGRVFDTNGNPLAPTTPTNFTMKFRIYGQQTGGAIIWSESQIVTVSNGNFSVRLGTGVRIPAQGGGNEGTVTDLRQAFNTTDRFLGLTVLIPPQAEGEIQPRLAFLSSPFSLVAERAKLADGVSQTTGTSTLGATTAASIVLSGNSGVNGASHLEFGRGVTGKEVNAGKIGYQMFTPGALDIIGAGTTATNRRVKIFAEGGTTFTGPISATDGSFTGPLSGTSASFSGNVSVANPGVLSFGATNRQMINLWSTNYGIGVQNNTSYARSEGGFSWFRGGTHSDTANDPGTNGSRLATLNSTGLGVGAVPSYRLHVSDSTFPTALIESSNAVGTWTTFKNGTSDRFFQIIATGTSNGEGAGKLLFTSGLLAGQVSQNYLTLVPGTGVGVNTSAPNATLSVNGSASKPGGGSWAVFSDGRLKKNVRKMEKPLERMLELEGVRFEYKDPAAINELPGEQIGMIAQQVEKVFPDWVGETPTGMKHVSVHGFEALTVEAVRELREEKDRQIEALEKRNAELEDRLKAIEAKMGL